ncbi:MAG: dGTP triphosphohydrolase [Phycisphaerales bacterium]
MFDWERLLSEARPPKEVGDSVKVDNNHPSRSTFEADCDRILFSKPFRRMARKTQVHPRSIDDHVHNRLTHSLEVASVGRTLGIMLAEYLHSRGVLPETRSKFDVASISQAACLAHDLGNPPFGHAGEYAIRDWFKTNGRRALGNTAAHSKTLEDWDLFEGNSQSFRLACRHDIGHTGYIRLSCASLGAMVKYPWFSSDERASEKGKLNFFHSEEELVRLVWAELGLISSDASLKRHPISFLTEAADDICYRVIDVEDAALLGIMSEERAKELFADILKAGPNPVSPDLAKPLEQLRGESIRHLIDAFWFVFEHSYDSIIAGERNKDLRAGLDPAIDLALEAIDLAYQEIFADREKVATELGSYKVLGKITKAMLVLCKQIADSETVSDVGTTSKSLAKFIWGPGFLEKHFESKDADWWLCVSRDAVASMTDNFAHATANAIEGTRHYQ